MPEFKSQQGNILLWTLIVISITLTSTLFLANLISTSLQQGRLVNDALKAWYLAESGVENGLYRLRQLDDSSWLAAAENLELEGGKLVRNQELEQSIMVNISKNDSYQLDLPSTADLASLNIKTAGSAGASWLEVQKVYWQTNTASPSWQGVDLKGPSDLENGFAINLTSNSYLYRIKLRALYGDIQDLVITAKNSGGLATAMPARIIFNSQGFFGNASQQIKVTMPRQTPAYGIFDYVIFSEEPINK